MQQMIQISNNTAVLTTMYPTVSVTTVLCTFLPPLPVAALAFPTGVAFAAAFVTMPLFPEGAAGWGVDFGHIGVLTFKAGTFGDVAAAEGFLPRPDPGVLNDGGEISGGMLTGEVGGLGDFGDLSGEMENDLTGDVSSGFV